MNKTYLFSAFAFLLSLTPIASRSAEVVLGPVVAVEKSFTIDPEVCFAQEANGAYCYVYVDSDVCISAQNDENRGLRYTESGVTVELFAHKHGYGVLASGSTDREAVRRTLRYLFATVPGSNVVKIIVHKHAN